MSPFDFRPSSTYALMFSVYDNGGDDEHSIVNVYGIRPIINLKSDVLYASGIGTENDPYIITIK